MINYLELFRLLIGPFNSFLRKLSILLMRRLLIGWIFKKGGGWFFIWKRKRRASWSICLNCFKLKKRLRPGLSTG